MFKTIRDQNPKMKLTWKTRQLSRPLHIIPRTLNRSDMLLENFQAMMSFQILQTPEPLEPE